jgi:integrase
MYIIPSLGKKPVVGIEPMDVTRMLDGVKKRLPTTANAVLRVTRRVFSFGVRRRIVLSNPTYDLNQRLDAGGTEKSRGRALNLDELAKLFAAFRITPSFGTENLLTTKLLLALCVRKNELIGARWGEFDLEGRTVQGPVWHLPGARTKTGDPLDIPLVPQVVDWLERLRVIGGESDWVYPGRKYDRHA